MAAAPTTGRWGRAGEGMLAVLAVFVMVAGGAWAGMAIYYGLSIDPAENWRGIPFYPVLDGLVALGLLAALAGLLVLRGVRIGRPLALASALLWLGVIAWYASRIDRLSLDLHHNPQRLFCLGFFAVIFSLAALLLVLRLRAAPIRGADLVARLAERRPKLLLFLLVVPAIFLFMGTAGGAFAVIGDLNFDSELARAGIDPAQGYSVESLRRLIRSNPARAAPYRLLSAYYHDGQRSPLSTMLAWKVYARRLAANQAERAVEDWEGEKSAYLDEDLENLAKELRGTRDGIVSLAREAADAGRIRIVRDFDPQTILSRPAAAGVGVLNLDQFELLRLACLYPKRCKESFASANLQRAAGRGIAGIDGPGNCCMLSLDDPDLRPISVGEAKAALAKSPELAEPVLAELSRMLFKQLFLLNFIASAPDGG